jgi:hypothetical protein
LALPKIFAANAPAESLDELYQKARKEGKVTIYAPLSSRSMEAIPPAFMKRFPGVTVDHIDATADKLLARIVSPNSAAGGYSATYSAEPCLI